MVTDIISLIKRVVIMRYASVFATILIVWVAIVVISGLTANTETTYGLYKITMVFTLGMFLFGFAKRK